MDYGCQIQEVAAAVTVAVKFNTSEATIERDTGLAFNKIQQYLVSIGEYPSGHPYSCFIRFGETWEVEAGLPVLHPLPGNGEVVPSSTPSGRFATTMHIGPPSDMKFVLPRLQRWMGEQGLAAKGPVYEICMSDPRITPPEQTYFGVMIPI